MALNNNDYRAIFYRLRREVRAARLTDVDDLVLQDLRVGPDLQGDFTPISIRLKRCSNRERHGIVFENLRLARGAH